MAKDKVNENKNKIVFNMPSSSKVSTVNDSQKDIELKDRLMKLIIDTHDETIELKVDGDHYRRVGIHDEWRQVDFDNKKATYFSYQERAAKDFIYRFNKCGILSDQVGMGKTIEAGMIITELAYRKELGSLLILVPNENMTEKWEVELARKFGYRNYYKDLEVVEGNEEHTIPYEQLPKVGSIKSFNDVYSIIYEAYDSLHNAETLDDKIKKCALNLFDKICDDKRMADIRACLLRLLEKNALISSKEFKMMVLKEIYSPLIYDFVKEISKQLHFENEFNNSHYEMNLNGIYYHIVDMNLDTPIDEAIVVNGIIHRLIDKELITNSLIYEFNFIKGKLGENIVDYINKISYSAKTDQERLSYVTEYREIAKKIKQRYSILIVSKAVGDGAKYANILNLCLNKDFESEATRHVSEISIAEKGYFFIDMLIDMGYKTLIVDEAHDYIKVSHKMKMSEDITSVQNYETREREGLEFADIDLSQTSKDYYVFPLYNDYYFVNKDCLYLKVKALAERSFRKIFMTATPIKSDMIDFYLLYLLADNSDVNTYNRIRRILNSSEYDMAQIANLIMREMSNPQKRAMNYVTHEDLIIKYINRYYVVNQAKFNGTFEEKIISIIKNIAENHVINKDIIKDICVSAVRKQFQETFTIKDEKTGKDVEITSISDLVTKKDGIEHWQNMYSQIGIRSTRHQTFKLDDEHLQLINKVQRDKYRNLPIWSRRNGTIFYINKRDNYFDLLVKEKLAEKKVERDARIDNEKDVIKYNILDYPKYLDMKDKESQYHSIVERIKSEDVSEVIKEAKINKETTLYNQEINKVENRYKPVETALSIYNYINKELTGVLSESYYDSKDVDYNEFKLHLVASLMTDGVLVEGKGKKKKIAGKVLLFTDQSTQKLVLDWLQEDAKEKSMSREEIESYVSKFKHHPIWYWNNTHINEEDKWVITTDIKSLKEKKGNYLIVVEPNKYEEGVDLQTSDILINFDIKFCPLKMEQRIGRIDRVKLCDEQPQLDIISFTPLNDMSGFMVDFLANELKMFNCWRGDTTGIVSMPLGEKPNSATYEDAIIKINNAYIALYNYDSKAFIAALKDIQDLINNFDEKDKFTNLNTVINNENKIIDDFAYLRGCAKHVNKIVYNSVSSNNSDENYKDVSFGRLKLIAEQMAVDEGRIEKESLTNHINDIKELRAGIDGYYNYIINKIQDSIFAIKKNLKTNDKTGTITPLHTGAQNNLHGYTKALEIMRNNYKSFIESPLYKMANNSAIKKDDLDMILKPIVGTFKQTLLKYLDVLLELFDYFCDNVKDKSEKMTRFISYLTIDEFKVMAGNYE